MALRLRGLELPEMDGVPVTLDARLPCDELFPESAVVTLALAKKARSRRARRTRG
jgi:hypothetical protein